MTKGANENYIANADNFKQKVLYCSSLYEPI